MGDLTFNEGVPYGLTFHKSTQTYPFSGLDMLENGEYSGWVSFVLRLVFVQVDSLTECFQVKAIFLGIKSNSFMRAIKKTSKLAEWVIERWFMRNPKIRVKVAGMLSF